MTSSYRAVQCIGLSEAKVKARISSLVDYIEGLQQK